MGKNKTRLQQNNTDLQAIKVTVEGLPTLPIPQVVTIDGVQHSEDLVFESRILDLEMPTIPYASHSGSAVVLNGEIHILGGNSNNAAHYKFNGSSWVQVSTLPYNFYNGSAVVLNGEIHILGSAHASYGTNHYKFNGTSWVKVSALPYPFYVGCAVVSSIVVNNVIHILGSSASTDYVKYYYRHYIVKGTIYTLIQ